MASHLEAEISALRLILSNVIARMAAANEDGGREMLREMTDQCTLAAEHMSAGPDRSSLVRQTQTIIEEFFKWITIT